MHKDYMPKKNGLIRNNMKVTALLILSFNCAVSPSYAGALDNSSSNKVRNNYDIRQASPVETMVINGSTFSAPVDPSVSSVNYSTENGTPNSSVTLNNDNFPSQPQNPKVGDVPVVTSASAPAKRTIPYDAEAQAAAVDGTLRIVPDSFEPTAREKEQEVYSLNEIRNPKSTFYSTRGMFLDDGSIRNSALTDAAKGVGVRAGFSYEAARINGLLQKQYRGVLDQRFPFFYLMLGSGRVIPPVITEVNNQQERSGNNFLYLSIGSYEIVKPASLALREPSWRDYLLLPVSDPRPPEGVRAEDGKEIDAWKKAVDAGWIEGKSEARRTFIANLNRLIRDYTGMQRYHSLAKKGAITIPRVQSIKSKRRVDGDRLFVGEERLEIKVSAKFGR